METEPNLTCLLKINLVSATSVSTPFNPRLGTMVFLGMPQKKVIFISGPTTKALPPPLHRAYSGHIFCGFFFSSFQKSSFFSVVRPPPIIIILRLPLSDGSFSTTHYMENKVLDTAGGMILCLSIFVLSQKHSLLL